MDCNMNILRHGWSLGLLLVCCCTFISCKDSVSTRVDYTLQQAGANRIELEKILHHYENQPSKLKAAHFLIANMVLHHSYEGWELDSLRQMKKIQTINKGIDKKILERWKRFDYRRLAIIRDVDVVKADILIDNIDLAFEVWEKRSWSKYYSFEDFCEYILPYRIDDEPFENWRRIYCERYAPILDSLYRGDDVVEAARVIANYLKTEGFFKHEDITTPHWGALFLLDTRIGYCRENCDIATYVMRALGIPIAMDFYKTSPSYNSRHFWSALIDTTGLAVSFNYAEEEISRQKSMSEKKKGKVYRCYYGMQPEKLDEIYVDKTIPAFFRNPLMKDVSEEYFPDDNIDILIDKNINEDWIYLCVFTGRELIPIDIGKPHSRKVEFKNIEQKLIYFPTYCKGGHMVVAGCPFMPKHGEVQYFIPDTLRRGKVTLTRKYPMRYNRMLLGTAVGVKIEGANRKDFRDSELLCQVVDSPEINYNVLKPAIKKKFRYVRYSAPQEKIIQLGEWYMYAVNSDQPIKAYSIEANHYMDELRHSWLELMMDDDWSTYYKSEVKGEQLIFDLGTPLLLDHFVIIPRNDDNFIRLGDLYELFYHDGVKGWISIGKQIAKDTKLYYESVPEGALLWLRNHTRGKEERCFYMEEGKQIFV